MAQRIAVLKPDPAVRPEPVRARKSVRKSPKRRLKTYVPPPQQQRILARHIAGESLSEIARKEGRHRATVTKLVRSEEAGQFVADMRAQLYGYLDTAMSAVLAGLRSNDHEFAYQILKDLGVVPSEEERRQMQVLEPAKNEDERRRDITAKLIGIALDRHRIYGTPMPELEAILGHKLDDD